MFNCLSLASSLCWAGSCKKQDFATDNVSVVEGSTKDEDEDFMIWALKHHIESNYKNQVRKETVETKDDEQIISFNTSSFSQISEKEKEGLLIPRVSILNFESIKNFNYDSEKEAYNNMEDKLKKIKKRFEFIKEIK